RPGFKAAAFREGVETLEDLVPGMVLEGVVTNVAAFGAFVDVGVHQDGLVHVSAMARSFVKDPRDVVKPGDIVRVKVLKGDKARKRIALPLRLDDEAGGKPRLPTETSRTEATPRSMPAAKPGPAPRSALADALRRAGDARSRRE